MGFLPAQRPLNVVVVGYVHLTLCSSLMFIDPFAIIAVSILAPMLTV